MAYKDPEKEKEYKRDWYLRNRDKVLENQKAVNKSLREAKRSYIREIKDSTPCADCGVSYPYYVMDFDHLRDKSMNIAEMWQSCSWKAIKEEIAKCEIVCSNCHRIRTHAA